MGKSLRLAGVFIMDGNLAMANHIVFAKEHDFEREEVWKDVVGYTGLYMVSNHGNVKSLRRNIVLRPTNDEGYLKIKLQFNRKTKSVRVHRVVAFAFIPNPENKSQINHINGIKDDNRVENLEWCTNIENIAHARKNGLVPKTVLSKYQIDNLRRINSRRIIDTETGKIYENAASAALDFGINKTTLRHYLLGYIFNKTTLKYI